MFFYDVPVYRIAQEDYESEKRKYVDGYLAGMRDFYEQNPDHKAGAEHMWGDAFGGAWRYNEIIGFIRLKFLGTQIRGEWWRTKAKRITKTRKKQFEYRYWKLAPEIDIPKTATNSEIFEIILQYLRDCQKELKGRYIDSSLLEKIGPHVDWRSVVRDA